MSALHIVDDRERERTLDYISGVEMAISTITLLLWL